MKRLFLVGQLLLLIILSACASGGSFDDSRSARKYQVIYDWEGKEGEAFYAYTVEFPENIRQAVEKELKGNYHPGYLIPMHFPEHPQYLGEGREKSYWCTVHGTDGRLLSFRTVNVEPGGTVHTKTSGEFKWLALGALTSPDNPAILYREALQAFFVIGDKAYDLDYMPGTSLQYTDSFIETKGGEVQNICQAPETSR